MLTAHSLFAWTIMSIGLVLLPGPDTMLVAGHAARRGLKAGMAAIGGIQLGGLLFVALCGFGFLSVLNAVPGLFMAVKIAGALYLAWMGLGLLRGAIRPQPERPDRLRLGASPFTQGFISTVLTRPWAKGDPPIRTLGVSLAGAGLIAPRSRPKPIQAR